MTMRIRSFALLSAVIALPAVPARAQLGEVDSRPTQGVFIPGGVIAGDADATALELNPGQLGFLSAPSLVLTGNWWSDSTPIPGRGGGAFFAQNVFGGLSLGVAVEGLRLPNDVSALAGGNGSRLGYGKLTAAAGFRLGRRLAFGLGWGHIFGSLYDGLDTFDVGLGWRPWSWLALGVVAHDVGEPSVRGARPVGAPDSLSRVWEAELALRPLGTNRLELAMAARVSEREGWSAWAPRFRASLLVARGWHLFGDATFAPIEGHDAFSKHGEVRGSAGLALDFEHVTLAAAALISRTSESVGGAGLLRVSGERSPSAFPGQHVERVALDGVGDERELLRVLVRLREAAADPSTVALLLETEGMDLGMARIEELREAVALLRRSGKRVFAYLESPRTREVMLAVACDRIVLHPAGSLELRGISQTTIFYKQLLDRLGIHFDLARIGKYKGAPEPFVQNEPSDAVLENRTQMLDAAFARLVRAVAEGRTAKGLDEARVRALIEQGLFTPPAALKAGLVDALKDEQEIDSWVRAELGRSDLDISSPDGSPRRPWSWRPTRVAVVLVNGTIYEGASRSLPFDAGTMVGADTIVAALDEARRDPSIRAIVLRVNSPGGSAFASDQIARAVISVRQAGKPVLVSMGDVAASGGYYIAAPGQAILANPSTLTGSIGVYAFKANGQELLHRLGLNVFTLRRGAHSDVDSATRPWTPEELARVQEGIQHTYDRFLDVVERGRRDRGLSRERIDQLGRGHIWSGEQALSLGLVDGFGGVMEAVTRAAQMGGVAPGPTGVPSIVVLPRPVGGLLGRLVGATGQAADDGTDGLRAVPAKETEPASSLVSPLVPALGAVSLPASGRAAIRLLAPLLYGRSEAILARLPFETEID